MPYALLVITVFLAVVLLLPKLVMANPSTVAKGARKSLAGSLFAMSAFFALRGLLPVAISLFLAGLFVYGAQKSFGRTQKSSGQRSSVRTSMLNMWLDHDSGNMDGEVIAGALAGRQLSQLQLPDLRILLSECIAAKDQSEALIVAYLDRVHPDWRDAGTERAGGSESMSRADALDILGLKEGASEKDIHAAYRRMMKKHHPDNGGSAWLAARINEANQILTSEQ
jgi:hypothetical protein